MKITFSFGAFVVEVATGRRVEPPRPVDEWEIADEPMANYLDDALVDRAIVGGTVRAGVEGDGSGRIVVDYWAPGSLPRKLVGQVGKFTTIQMRQGLGSDGYEVDGHRGLKIFADLARSVEVTQVDDGRLVGPPSKVAIAARDGNLPALREALASMGDGESVDARLGGYPALLWAVLRGHADAAILLVGRGADVHQTAHMVDTPLTHLVSTKFITDADAGRLARVLLDAGADPDRPTPFDGKTARQLAREYGRRGMLAEFPPEADA